MSIPTALSVICVCVAFVDAYWFCSTTNDIVRAMENEGIGVEITNALPSKKLTVTYFEQSVEVSMGNELKPKEALDTPAVDWDGADENKNYTLILIDADFPSRAHPERREFLHWMVVNIHGNLVHEGEEIVEYIPPLPLNGTGLHRYVFLAYEQEDGLSEFFRLTHTDKRTLTGRELFSTNAFAIEYGLIIVPTAGNFFKAQYDDSVSEVLGQIGSNDTALLSMSVVQKPLGLNETDLDAIPAALKQFGLNETNLVSGSDALKLLGLNETTLN